MNTLKKPTNITQKVVSRMDYVDMKKQRDAWRDDFHDLFAIVMSMSLWQRIKFVFTKGVK